MPTLPAVLLGLTFASAAPAEPPPITYGPMQRVGQLADARINESSGLAASRLRPGEFWTHNDSGGRARLFRFNADGQSTATVYLDLPRPRDWEDLASFEWNGQPWLLVADVGDNHANREFVTLWLLPEPDVDGEARPGEKRPAVRLDLTYADGPRDCESVAVDPVRGEVLLITKVDPRRDFRDQSAVYLFSLREALHRVRTAGDAFGPLVVDRAATLPLKITVAADVSPDGLRCVVATYGDAWVFTRSTDEPWPAAFARQPEQIALGPRGQSEALALAPDGQTLTLTAEGERTPIWRVTPLDSP
jgi:hypothetical protein